MKTVRCKFRCHSIEEYPNGKFKATMFAVHSGSPENEKFFSFTPAGNLELSTMNEKNFRPGKQYYLDITEAK